MRFSTLSIASALFTTLVLAQQNAISIPEGQSTLDITADTPETITWTNPSDGTVTIKLQQEPVTPDGGIVLASNIPASAGTATFTIPADQVNTFQYTIEIIDDSNPENYNFSPNFGVKGATGTDTSSSSASGSSTASATDSSSLTSTTDSSSATTTDSSSSTITDSSSLSSATATDSSSTSTTSSADSTESTSAPNSNGAAAKQGASLMALIAVGGAAVVAF